jgi:hypothetical protein
MPQRSKPFRLKVRHQLFKLQSVDVSAGTQKTFNWSPVTDLSNNQALRQTRQVVRPQAHEGRSAQKYVFGGSSRDMQT